MARLARAEIFDPSEIAVVQLIGKTVRSCYLMEFDELYGKDFDHRKRLIDYLVDAQVTKAPSVADIAKAVGRELQITMDLLRGPGRKSSVVRARGLAMFLIRQWTVESYQNIGVFFGGRDHTTVMHACKKTEEDLANDHELTRTVDRVRQRLKLST